MICDRCHSYDDEYLILKMEHCNIHQPHSRRFGGAMHLCSECALDLESFMERFADRRRVVGEIARRLPREAVAVIEVMSESPMPFTVINSFITFDSDYVRKGLRCLQEEGLVMMETWPDYRDYVLTELGTDVKRVVRELELARDAE